MPHPGHFFRLSPDVERNRHDGVHYDDVGEKVETPDDEGAQLVTVREKVPGKDLGIRVEVRKINSGLEAHEELPCDASDACQQANA